MGSFLRTNRHDLLILFYEEPSVTWKQINNQTKENDLTHSLLQVSKWLVRFVADISQVLFGSEVKIYGFSFIWAAGSLLVELSSHLL